MALAFPDQMAKTNDDFTSQPPEVAASIPAYQDAAYAAVRFPNQMTTNDPADGNVMYHQPSQEPHASAPHQNTYDEYPGEANLPHSHQNEH